MNYFRWFILLINILATTFANTYTLIYQAFLYITHYKKNTGSTSFDSLSSIHVYNFTECILLHQQCTTKTKATTNTSFSILNTTTKYIYRYIHWFSGTSIDFFMLSRLFMIQPSKILFDVDLYLNHASP